MSDELKDMIFNALADREKMLRAGKNNYPKSIIKIAKVMATALAKKHKILICGNGGSAADSQHFAAEMIVRLTSKIERAPLAAISLTTDTSILTAAGNDYGFENIFARQVQGLGKKGDILFAISTSGNSFNVVKAINSAQSKGMTVIECLLGSDGGAMKDLCDYAIIIPSQSTLRIQEEHIFVIHTLVELIEQLVLEEA